MELSTFQTHFSQYYKDKIPFLFLIDFECQQPFICKLELASEAGIFYDLKGFSNLEHKIIDKKPEIEILPIAEKVYAEKFSEVMKHLYFGNTYLLNLTFPTEIKMNLSLEDVFHQAKAPYKLLFKDQFVVFSPESFIQIQQNEISTFPMKGTIDARLENAEEILRNNKKEQQEHSTIVDLMRNDLFTVAENVSLAKYRYFEKIKTHKHELFQTSSEIKGILSEKSVSDLGAAFLKLLPAGSVSGAPKQKTLEIIKENEIDSRGYYTGIFGISDGEKLDSCVNIRFIEQKSGKFFFRSGGGITINSTLTEEYQELIQKIFIPTE